MPTCLFKGSVLYIVVLVILVYVLVQYCNVHDENVVVQSKILIIYQVLYIYTIYTINIFMLLEIAGSIKRDTLH